MMLYTVLKNIPFLGVCNMLAMERKARIKTLVMENKSVIVSYLAREFSVNEETIRRDLKALEKEGVLTRTYGGAFVQNGVINDVSVSLRKTAYLENKRTIATRCLELIRNGDSIFLDHSTTALEIAKATAHMNITVVTNSLLAADYLAQKGEGQLILIGGVFEPKNRCFAGNAMLDALEGYYVDMAFLSCRSVDLENGVTDSAEQSAAIRRRVLRRTERSYLVADHTKFGKTSFLNICGLDALNGIVTDETLSEAWHTEAARLGLTILDGR